MVSIGRKGDYPMKNLLNDKHFKKVYPWLVCLLPMMMALYCCIIKSGGFIDEYFSLGFSNSSKGAYLLDCYDGNFLHRVITADELNDYIMVNGDEAFSYGFIIDNCTSDLTPPLYYFILHTICSFFPGVASKWFGLSINLVAFLVTLFFIYRISMLMYKSSWVSTLLTLCYGFSMGGLNCVTYVRMYAMVTMWSVLLLYFALQVLFTDKKRYIFACSTVIFLGFHTQYNFGIFAFFVCAAVCVGLLYLKEKKKFFNFSVCAVSGVLLFLLTWPTIFVQADRLLTWENENSKVSVGIVLFFYYWISMIFKQVRVEVFVSVFLIVSIAVLKYAVHADAGKVKEKLDMKLVTVSYIVLVISYILGTLGIAYYSPYFSARYCFNTMPVLTLMMGLLFIFFKELLRDFFEKKNIRFSLVTVGTLFVLAVIGGAVNLDEMKYLYLDNPEKLKVTDSVASYPCIFVNGNFDKSVINSIDHLVKFRDFYIFDELDLTEYEEYMSGHPNNEALVVYVDVDPFNSSGMDGDEVIGSFAETGLYDTILVLYELDSVRAFLLYNSETADLADGAWGKE